ncbi:TPA: GNAT family N-acetyltransferase [Listeria monocytogenes]|nr:GNAT family N-acetyltransferase [Listeria monocytogenes]
MEFCLAKEKDILQIMKLIEEAKEFLKQMNIDQWQNGYPDYKCIQSDIREKKAWLIIKNKEILGYACVDFDGEIAYNSLKGKWLSNKQQYVVMHRLTVSNKIKGHGLSTKIIKFIEHMAIEEGIYSVRVDTDANNLIMKSVLEKNGFVYCGTINFDQSDKIAYEKLIKRRYNENI